jgi:hypothetical protein
MWDLNVVLGQSVVRQKGFSTHQSLSRWVRLHLDDVFLLKLKCSEIIGFAIYFHVFCAFGNEADGFVQCRNKP